MSPRWKVLASLRSGWRGHLACLDAQLHVRKPEHFGVREFVRRPTCRALQRTDCSFTQGSSALSTQAAGRCRSLSAPTNHL